MKIKRKAVEVTNNAKAESISELTAFMYNDNFAIVKESTGEVVGLEHNQTEAVAIAKYLANYHGQFYCVKVNNKDDVRAAKIWFNKETRTMRRVTIDLENNAEEFFAALAEKYPAIDQQLSDGEAVITDEEWQAIRLLPGFANGPDYAREALVEIEEQ